MRRGEPRRVHSRGPRCRFLLAFARFSRPRCLLERATSDGLPRRIHSWRLTCTGPRTERRTCHLPGRETRLGVSTSGAYAFNRACGQRSHPRRSSGRPMSSVGRPIGEETRYQPTDRPRSPFRHGPAKDRAIPTTGTPFTVSNARGQRGGLLHSAAPRRSPAHAAHIFSRGRDAFVGPCKRRESAVTRVHGIRETSAF